METYKHEKSITEARIHKFLTEKYGNDTVSRAKKVEEEHTEFQEALIKYKNNPIEKNLLHLRDEMSDLYVTVSHAASTIEMYHRELLEMGVDKIKEREINPNYKRFK
jgi:hypothetical protein